MLRTQNINATRSYYFYKHAINVTSTLDSRKLGISTPTILGANRGLLATMGTAPTYTVGVPVAIYGAAGNGIGVVGVSNNDNGVYGYSAASNIGGVKGESPAAAGYGVWGIATGGGTAGRFDGGTSGKGLIVSSGNVGIGTISPASTMEVAGTFATSIIVLPTTANPVAYNAGGENTIIVYNPTANYTVTLPNPVTCRGRLYNIRRYNGILYTVTVASAGGTIVGVSTFSYLSATVRQGATYQSDGTNWITIAEF